MTFTGPHDFDGLCSISQSIISFLHDAARLFDASKQTDLIDSCDSFELQEEFIIAVLFNLHARVAKWFGHEAEASLEKLVAEGFGFVRSLPL